MDSKINYHISKRKKLKVQSLEILLKKYKDSNRPVSDSFGVKTGREIW